MAYDESYAPYSFVENGEVKGIMPDLLELLLGQIEGLRLEHRAFPWRRTQAEVKAGSADAMCTFASEERLQYAKPSKTPLLVLKPSFFYLANSPARAVIESAARREDLFDLQLLDLAGNQWAEQNLKVFPKIEFVGSLDSVFKMLTLGRADLHISLSPVVSRWRIRKLGLDGTKILSKPAPFISSDVPFSWMVRKTLPDVDEVLARFEANVQRPAVAAAIESIYRRYGV